MTKIRFRLGNFVCVVGECVVDAAAVNVQILAQMLHGDTGAFNVPAGIADTPGRIPFQGLVFKLGLGKPEDKVILIALVFIYHENMQDELISLWDKHDFVSIMARLLKFADNPILDTDGSRSGGDRFFF